MHRILALVAAAAILLGIAAPVALAADPEGSSRSVVVAVAHDVDVPAGDHVGTLVVVRGNAMVGGSVDQLVIVDGTASLAGTTATAGTITVVNGTADLGAGTTVTGDVRTFDGTVTRADGAIVGGSTRAFEANVAAFAILLIPLFILLLVGFALAGLAAALFVAAFAARQVREAEALISREPGTVLVAGLIGSFVLPILALLVTVTVVGAPIGLGALLVVLPALAFVGWIVAAIWVGDWILGRARGASEAGHPYLAAVVGVVVLAVAGIVPFVSAIATLFGYGALLVMGWRILRPPTATPAAGMGGPDPAGPQRELGPRTSHGASREPGARRRGASVAAMTTQPGDPGDGGDRPRPALRPRPGLRALAVRPRELAGDGRDLHRPLGRGPRGRPAERVLLDRRLAAHLAGRHPDHRDWGWRSVAASPASSGGACRSSTAGR